MQTQIRWNTKELTKDLPEDESGFYKAIGELLPEIEIPNRLHISCHMGDMKIAKKEHVYPLVPFLTVGYIITLIILIIQGQHISWLL